MLKLYEPRCLFSMINKNKLKKKISKDSATHMAFTIWHTVLAHCKALQVVSPFQTSYIKPLHQRLLEATPFTCRHRVIAA